MPIGVQLPIQGGDMTAFTDGNTCFQLMLDKIAVLLLTLPVLAGVFEFPTTGAIRDTCCSCVLQLLLGVVHVEIR